MSEVSMNNVLLSVQNLVVRYGHISALKNISFDVKQGEITALVGANGAGKSTSLLTISGLLKPVSGHIQYRSSQLGQLDLTKLRPNKIVQAGVAQVAEGRAILTTLTVQENLQLGAYTRKDPAGVEEDLKWVKELFPILSSRSAEYAGNLSGGEQQMLAIARALMSRPELLLLDEPSMGLAPLKVKEIFKVLKEINQEGQSILLVEQNVKQALQIAGHGYVIENGEIALEGSGKDLLGDPRVIQAYLGV
jgi:branched-chain amino acid transport system ATP-binding protein